MNKETVQIILKRELAHKPVFKYSVKQYRAAANISHSAFYRDFQNIYGLYRQAVQIEIKQFFRQYPKGKLHRLIYALLTAIKKDKIYFKNLHHLATKNLSVHICYDIIDTLFEELKKFLANSNLSRNRIKSIAFILFVSINDWVAHDCKDSVLTIYQKLNFILIEKF